MTRSPACVPLPLVARAETYGSRLAIVSGGQAYTYETLLAVSADRARGLLATQADRGLADRGLAGDLQEARVAFLLPSAFDYVAVQWAIWRSGGVAVPLCTLHPEPELAYVIDQCGATILVTQAAWADRLRPIAEARQIPLLLIEEAWPDAGSLALAPDARLPTVAIDRPALILYTSGTTGKPKGVVLTHANLQAQVTSLVAAWGWTASDRILQILPLHHIHGIVNILTCALWSGAECEMHGSFEAAAVWQAIADRRLTLLMAVPTIYVKLIQAWDQARPDRQAELTAACDHVRLMVSGSAALPTSVLATWQRMTGHVLLERYGMTEIGMALSNPLVGDRQPGLVGQPLPGVQVRLVDQDGQPVPVGQPGEIEVQGPNVFRDYWQNPTATAQAFRDRWFRTGDYAVLEPGGYRILGRLSVDIIKTGGYKVSALEIEAVLLTHPDIAECAVVALADPEWGERVAVAIVLRSNPEPTAIDDRDRSAQALSTHQTDATNLAHLRAWLKERLAVYKVPSRLRIVPSLPRNALGKLTKPQVAQLFQETPT